MSNDIMNISMEELKELFEGSDAKIPYIDLMTGLLDFCCMMDDVTELIHLIRQESELKKHHRPYLHVRDALESKAEQMMARVSILHKKTLERMMKGFPEVSSCEDCEDYDRCKCSTVCDEGGNHCSAALDSVTISKEKYDSMVDDLLTMAELIDMVTDMRTRDMEAIRTFAKFVPYFAAYEHNRLRLYHEAAKEAEEIIDRWADDLDDEDEPDEYFSD